MSDKTDKKWITQVLDYTGLTVDGNYLSTVLHNILLVWE